MHRGDRHHLASTLTFLWKGIVHEVREVLRKQVSLSSRADFRLRRELPELYQGLACDRVPHQIYLAQPR